MKTEELCKDIFAEACNVNITFYKQMLSNQKIEEVSDLIWRNFLEVVRALPTKQQEIILEFVRQATIDTASTVLGGIDGITSLNGKFFKLSLSDSDGSEHAGNLQESFLSIAGDMRSNN